VRCRPSEREACAQPARRPGACQQPISTSAARLHVPRSAESSGATGAIPAGSMPDFCRGSFPCRIYSPPALFSEPSPCSLCPKSAAAVVPTRSSHVPREEALLSELRAPPCEERAARSARRVRRAALLAFRAVRKRRYAAAAGLYVYTARPP